MITYRAPVQLLLQIQRYNGTTDTSFEMTAQYSTVLEGFHRMYHVFTSHLSGKLLFPSLPNLGRSIFPNLFKYVNLLISLLFPPALVNFALFYCTLPIA